MNHRVRKMLGGIGTASLIMAGTLPATAQYDPHTSCPTRAKTKVESSKEKAKDNGAKKKVEKAPEKSVKTMNEKSSK
jgi:hypothetical protein